LRPCVLQKETFFLTVTTQLQLTSEQQTQLLTELAETGPADDLSPEAKRSGENLRAAVAAGAPEVTPELLALLRAVAESNVPISLEVRAEWQATYRRACALALFAAE